MSRRKGRKHHNKKCQEEFCSKLDGCGCEFWLAVRRNNVRKSFLAIVILLFVAGLTVAQQSNVQVYGDVAVVVGVFRIKGREKGRPYVHRERFLDTWIKVRGTWQCVATTSTLITAK